MKKTVLTLAIVLGGLALLTPAVEAGHRHGGFGFSFGFGGGGGFVGGFVGHRHRSHRHQHVVYAPPVHVHHRMPYYRQVWVPARYEQVFAGYDFGGRPIYRTVCVSHGHYESVVAGYRCGCGHSF